LKHKLHVIKTYELPEDGQKSRPKHVGELINKKKALCDKLVLNFTRAKQLHGKCLTLNII